MRQCDNFSRYRSREYAYARARMCVCVCVCLYLRVSEWMSEGVSERARVWVRVNMRVRVPEYMSVYPSVWTRMSLLCSFRVSLSLSFARATVLLVVRDDRLSRISCTFFACPIVKFSFARNKLFANCPWPISGLCVRGSGHAGICFAIRSGSELVRIHLKGIRTTKQPWALLEEYPTTTYRFVCLRLFLRLTVK